jgi:hypothetical protein
MITRFIAALIIPGIMLFFGRSITASSHETIELGHASESWPAATGVIERSESQHYAVHSTSRNRNDRGRTTTTELRARASIRYSYTVDGKRLQGSALNVVFAPQAFAEERPASEFVEGKQHHRRNERSEAEARKLIERYPPGETVEIRYNPDSPQMAVLEAGIPAEAATNLWAGRISMILAPIVFLLVLMSGRKAPRRARPSP